MKGSESARQIYKKREAEALSDTIRGVMMETWPVRQRDAVSLWHRGGDCALHKPGRVARVRLLPPEQHVRVVVREEVDHSSLRLACPSALVLEGGRVAGRGLHDLACTSSAGARSTRVGEAGRLDHIPRHGVPCARGEAAPAGVRAQCLGQLRNLELYLHGAATMLHGALSVHSSEPNDSLYHLLV